MAALRTTRSKGSVIVPAIEFDRQEPHEDQFLRNGSTLDGLPPQVFEAQQHGQGAFQFSIEVDLITGETL